MSVSSLSRVQSQHRSAQSYTLARMLGESRLEVPYFPGQARQQRDSQMFQRNDIVLEDLLRAFEGRSQDEQ